MTPTELPNVVHLCHALRAEVSSGGVRWITFQPTDEHDIEIVHVELLASPP